MGCEGVCMWGGVGLGWGERGGGGGGGGGKGHIESFGLQPSD